MKSTPKKYIKILLHTFLVIFLTQLIRVISNTDTIGNIHTSIGHAQRPRIPPFNQHFYYGKSFLKILFWLNDQFVSSTDCDRKISIGKFGKKVKNLGMLNRRVRVAVNLYN